MFPSLIPSPSFSLSPLFLFVSVSLSLAHLQWTSKCSYDYMAMYSHSSKSKANGCMFLLNHKLNLPFALTRHAEYPNSEGAWGAKEGEREKGEISRGESKK